MSAPTFLLRQGRDAPRQLAEAFVELMGAAAGEALPHLRALLTGRAAEAELRGVMRAASGRGLLVTVTLTPLDARQMEAMERSDLGEEGQA
jgi:hypothetical protein